MPSQMLSQVRRAAPGRLSCRRLIAPVQESLCCRPYRRLPRLRFPRRLIHLRPPSATVLFSSLVSLVLVYIHGTFLHLTVNVS